MTLIWIADYSKSLVTNLVDLGILHYAVIFYRLYRFYTRGTYGPSEEDILKVLFNSTELMGHMPDPLIDSIFMFIKHTDPSLVDILNFVLKLKLAQGDNSDPRLDIIIEFIKDSL